MGKVASEKVKMMLKLGVKRYFRLDVNSLTVVQRQLWYNRQILLLLNSARRVAKTDPTGIQRRKNEPALTSRRGGVLPMLALFVVLALPVSGQEVSPINVTNMVVTNDAILGWDTNGSIWVTNEITAFTVDPLWVSGKVITNVTIGVDLDWKWDVEERLAKLEVRSKTLTWALLTVAIGLAIVVICLVPDRNDRDDDPPQT